MGAANFLSVSPELRSEGYLDSLEKVKEVLDFLRVRFVSMVELEREIVAVGGILYCITDNYHEGVV